MCLSEAAETTFVTRDLLSEHFLPFWYRRLAPAILRTDLSHMVFELGLPLGVSQDLQDRISGVPSQLRFSKE